MNYFVLAAGTVILVVISWLVSIREKRFHGIARFFSFESIFILFLMNWRMWFHDPFSWNQLIAWVLLFLSIYPVVAGFILLKRKGKSEKSLENTTVLIKSGIYNHIRHPLYCSLLLLGTGIMFKDPGLLQITAGVVNIIALFFTARIEEKEMTKRFGDQYTDYMKETKMFIPYLV